MVTTIFFILFAALAIGGALGTVLSRNAIHSALSLILTMAMLAVFYLMLNAPFIAMVQLAVYAGAIMVLFLFVIMLLGAERLAGVAGGSRWQMYLALLLAGLLFVLFTTALVMQGTGFDSVAAVIEAGPEAVGLRLFEAYVFPFEVTSVLLLVAMVGVLVLRSRKPKKGE
jgi:NADH-quinone oxidoreductase subunit J